MSGPKHLPIEGCHQCWQVPEARRDKEGFSLGAVRERDKDDTFISASRTVRQYISVVLGHFVFGDFSGQAEAITGNCRHSGFAVVYQLS